MLILVTALCIVIFASAILIGRIMAGRSLRRLEMLIDQVRPLCQHPDAQPAALAALHKAEEEHEALQGKYLEDLIDRSNAAYLALQTASREASVSVLASDSARRKEVSAGLEGVVAFETALGQVFGEEGRLVYRGFNAVDLAVEHSIESVWLLLREGRLPDAATLLTFKKRVEKAGVLSRGEIDLVRKLRGDQPLSALRTAISAIANKRDFKPWLDRDLAEVDSEIMALTAITPAIIEVLRTGKAPIKKPGNTGYAQRYLWGVLGSKPSELQTKAIEIYMILTMDHGSNASTFSGRVTVSTGADVGAALSAATATLSGPLHGGAPGPVLDMLDAIGTRENAEPWVKEQLEKGRKLMGFGHRVYRTEDPRARTLRYVAERLDSPRVELARAVELTILAALEERQKAKATRLGTSVRTLRVNVEFWTAVVLDHVGIPRSLFSSTFCASRMIGWGEQIREQIRDNKLFRPLSKYIEPASALYLKGD
ncbi:MAG: citrate synthase/methylcitrate synthase [Cyanobacteria bacterium HKST-UBA02]|nr:citrate synthase/methylcitrate synthase [Cyanobacteria bacterium HKST-UBA02]